MATPWQPNFRLTYWFCLGIAGVGGVGAVWGLIVGTYWLFPSGCGIAILALAVVRLKGLAKLPIPGLKNPLEGDFVPIGDPRPLEELVTLEAEDPEQPPEPAPPRE